MVQRKPRTPRAEKNNSCYEQCIVVDGCGKITMQQRVQRARRTAAGTVQAGQLVERATRKKTVPGRIKEKNGGDDWKGQRRA